MLGIACFSDGLMGHARAREADNEPIYNVDDVRTRFV